MKKAEVPLQQGFILISTIILILVLTILAITQMSFNGILTRMATNSADALVAFETAEGALNQAVNAILTTTPGTSSFMANANGLYLYKASSSPVWASANWSDSSAIQSYQGNSSKAASYIIEQLPSVVLPGQSMNKPSAIYRVTAKAVGASGGSPVILQALVRVSAN